MFTCLSMHLLNRNKVGKSVIAFFFIAFSLFLCLVSSFIMDLFCFKCQSTLSLFFILGWPQNTVILLLQPLWVGSSQVCMIRPTFSVCKSLFLVLMQLDPWAFLVSEIILILFMTFWVWCFSAYIHILWNLLDDKPNTRTVSLNIWSLPLIYFFICLFCFIKRILVFQYATNTILSCSSYRLNLFASSYEWGCHTDLISIV